MSSFSRVVELTIVNAHLSPAIQRSHTSRTRTLSESRVSCVDRLSLVALFGQIGVVGTVFATPAFAVTEGRTRLYAEDEVGRLSE